MTHRRREKTVSWLRVHPEGSGRACSLIKTSSPSIWRVFDLPLHGSWDSESTVQTGRVFSSWPLRPHAHPRPSCCVETNTQVSKCRTLSLLSLRAEFEVLHDFDGSNSSELWRCLDAARLFRAASGAVLHLPGFGGVLGRLVRL